MRILIGAHYNLNNGDRALLEATVQLIKKYSPNSEIIVSAAKPDLLDDSKARFSVVDWPLHNKYVQKCWGKIYQSRIPSCLKEIFLSLFLTRTYKKAIKNTDVVLISGGHHLTDLLGSDSYYRLAASFSIPNYFKKTVHLLPQSLGPAHNKDILQNIKKILDECDSIAFRDDSSREFIGTLNIKTKNQYVPDLVFSLDVEKYQRSMDLVGIALYHSYAGENKKILDLTIPNLIKVIMHLLKNNYRVIVIPMDKGDDTFYESMCQEIPDEYHDRFLLGRNTEDIVETIQQFSKTKFSITYKTHSTIFAMIANIPLVAVAYHPKTIEFMESVGLPEYAIKDTEATFENLIDKLELINKNYDIYLEREANGVNNNRSLINEYFSKIVLQHYH